LIACATAAADVPLTPAARTQLGGVTARAAVQDRCAQQRLALRWQSAAQAYDSVPRDAAYEAAWRSSCEQLRAALPLPILPPEAPRLQLTTAAVAFEQPASATLGWQIVAADAPADLAGLAVEQYLGGHAWLVRVTATTSLARVRGVAPLLPAHKVAAALFDETAYQLGDDPAYRMLDVLGFGSTSADQLQQAVRACGGEVFSVVQTIPAVLCRVPVDAIAALAARDDVQWIGKTPPALSACNNTSRTALGVNTAHTAPYSYRGTNINVLVYDAGIANFHQDFTNRTIYKESNGVDEHSTHVAGTLLGDGRESSGTYRGMAPEARLITYMYHFSSPVFYNNPGDLETNYTVAINTYGADLANNSLGMNVVGNMYPTYCYGDYETSAILLDQIALGRLGRPLFMVWAAGNERSGTPVYANISPPQTAKNTLVVGGTSGTTTQEYSKTSYGPLDDGRLKPDLAAPGANVRSCQPYGGYQLMSGTSMASPAACGCAALLLQCWRALYGGSPSPAMYKAILVNTTIDIGSPGPGFDLGYGLLQIVPALDTVRAGNMLEASVGQSVTRRFPIIVPATAALVRVTLAWSDPPASPLAAKTLVNDLDVRLIDPAGRVFLPWVLDPKNPSLPATTNFPDRLNNLEQIQAANLTPGVWYAEVRGALIAMGATQSFALAANCTLRDISRAGTVQFDAPAYRAPGAAQMQVRDLDLTNQPTCAVLVRSSSEPAGETIICTAVAPGFFTGAVALTTLAPAADGLLSVAHGAIINAGYVDSDNGAGGLNVTNTATARADLLPPQIYNVRVEELTDTGAAVCWQTDEDAYGDVRIVAPISASNQTSAGTAHAARFTTLAPTTACSYIIIARDLCGNVATNDNSGLLFSFTTRRFQPLWYSNAELGEPLAWTSTGFWYYLNTTCAWHQSARRVLAGTNSWYCGLEATGRYPTSLNSSLVSTAITVTQDRASLRFREYIKIRAVLDSCYVQAATNAALTWFDLRGVLSITMNSTNDVIIPLDDLVPGIVRLRFRITSSSGGTPLEGWYLDNLAVGVCLDSDLALDAVHVYDPAPGGNADGFIAPGETVGVRTVLFNGRANALSNVAGVLTCVNGYASLLTDSTGFGTAAAGATCSNTAPFVCAVASHALPGAPLSFILLTTPENEPPASNQFTLTVLPEPAIALALAGAIIARRWHRACNPL